ncbi:MAG: histidinol-phosphate aminotransferase family protein [Oscillospiraceae bacterium]|jgi:histidinol-phosphate aminotransferase|nr:histidinol-phosphate aminotransferase family protein [Oscillospiraceae bacterium]
MYQLPQKVKDLVPYEPIFGDYKIRLDVNELPVNLSDATRQKIADKLMQIEFNRYPDPLATELIEAFADFYGISPNLVTAGNGSDELIFLIEAALLNSGDKILVCNPDFSMYAFNANVTGLQAVVYQKNDLQINIDELIAFAKSENVSAIVFSNPCNPTGIGLKADDVRKLITSVEVLVIADEAYMDFWDESLLPQVENYDNLIILKTASKLFGAAAMRLGFAVANKTITNALRSVKSPYNVNSLSQAFGTIVFGQKAEVMQNLSKVKAGIKLLQDKFCEFAATRPNMRVYPTAANFIFIKTDEGEQIASFLLEKSIVVRKFADHLRICCGTEQENAQLIAAMEEYYNS